MTGPSPAAEPDARPEDAANVWDAREGDADADADAGPSASPAAGAVGGRGCGCGCGCGGATGVDGPGAPTVDSGAGAGGDEGADASTGVLAVATAANFSQLGARLAVAPVVPFVLTAFGATRSTVGLALGGMWATYALAQFPSGVLGDRYGERRLVLLALAGAAAGSVALAAVPTLGAFVGAALVLGAGAGLFFAPTTSLLTRLYGERRGGALGVLTAGGSVAGAAVPAVVGVAAVRLGWRPALLVGAVVAVPAFVAAAVAVPRVDPVAPDRSLRDAVDPARLRALIARPGVAYSVVLGAVGGYTFQAFSSFYPTFLVQFRGVDPGAAGVALGAAFALSAAAQTVAGRLSDAVDRDVALAASFVVAATGVVVLLAVPGLVGVVVGTATFGAGISWPGVVQARIMDQFDDADRGTGFGLARTAYMFLAVTGSVLTGVLADLGGWPAAYGATIAVLAGGVCLLGLNRALGWGL